MHGNRSFWLILLQVGKGRDVGLNQIALFEGKVAGGNGEQVLSRDVYRLGQLFDFFRMLSFFFTTVGYYFCTMVSYVSSKQLHLPPSLKCCRLDWTCILFSFPTKLAFNFFKKILLIAFAFEKLWTFIWFFLGICWVCSEIKYCEREQSRMSYHLWSWMVWSTSRI